MALTTDADDYLIERIARDCDAVIDAELSRLRRRRPRLSESDLAALDKTLSALANRLLLDALRRRPELIDTIAPIFTIDSPVRAGKEEDS